MHGMSPKSTHRGLALCPAPPKTYRNDLEGPPGLRPLCDQLAVEDNPDRIQMLLGMIHLLLTEYEREHPSA